MASYEDEVKKRSFWDQNPYTEEATQQQMASRQDPIQKASIQAQPAQQGGGTIDLLSDAGMSSGHPGVTSAALALKTAQMVNDNRFKRRQMQYKAEVQKLAARQEAINRLAQIGQNLKA